MHCIPRENTILKSSELEIVGQPLAKIFCRRNGRDGLPIETMVMVSLYRSSSLLQQEMYLYPLLLFKFIHKQELL